MCRDLKLTWSNEFKLLGINFNNNLDLMNNNWEKPMTEAKKIIQNWKFRNPSPLAKLHIQKVLILSKFTHIPIVLPSIYGSAATGLDKLLKNFIWGTTSKVSGARMEMPINEGGLAYINIPDFWDGLKISWFKRGCEHPDIWTKLLLQQLRESGHNYDNLSEILKEGDLTMLKISQNSTNKFWKEAFKTLSTLRAKYDVSHMDRFMNSPIFSNSNIGNRLAGNTNMIVNNKGLQAGQYPWVPPNAKPKYLYRNNLRITTETLATNLNAVHAAIPLHGMLMAIKKTHATIPKTTYRDIYKNFKDFICKKKGTKRFRVLLRKKTETVEDFKVYKSWNTNIHDHLETQTFIQGSKASMKLPLTPELRWLKFRIVNRIIGVKNLTSKIIQYIENKCTFCEKAGNPVPPKETIEHIFFDCPHVAPLRVQLTQWLPDTVDIGMNIIEFLIHHEGNNKTNTVKSNCINSMITHYIWLCRMKTSIPTLNGAKNYLLAYFKLLNNANIIVGQNKLFWECVNLEI